MSFTTQNYTNPPYKDKINIHIPVENLTLDKKESDKTPINAIN